MDKEPNMGKLAPAHFGHLPVWVKGNAYFNGAAVGKHETEGFENKKNKVSVKLVEKNGKIGIKTNLYPLLKDFKDGIITSDILGCAFEPEQRFENPDGTAITFDSDFLGNHRGLSTIPGPFADALASESVLWNK
jgi:hypothetical protein